MSLDHDLENLPRLSDEDREALDNPYIVMPAVQSDEAIAMRDAATEHAPSQQSTDDDETKSLEQRIESQRQELFDAMAIVVITRDSFESDGEDHYIFRALDLVYRRLDDVAAVLDDVSNDVQKLDRLAQVGQCIKSMMAVSHE